MSPEKENEKNFVKGVDGHLLKSVVKQIIWAREGADGQQLAWLMGDSWGGLVRQLGSIVATAWEDVGDGWGGFCGARATDGEHWRRCGDG